MQRHIEVGTFAGSVTRISRNGRVALLTAQGLMELERLTVAVPNTAGVFPAAPSGAVGLVQDH